jgi:hypothetical protein
MSAGRIADSNVTTRSFSKIDAVICGKGKGRAETDQQGSVTGNELLDSLFRLF